MCYQVGIGILAGNALIALLSKAEEQGDSSKEIRVSLSTLYDYGVAVVKILNEKNEEAVLLASRERTDSFISWCSDLVRIEEYPSPRASIVLQEGVTKEDLLARFAGAAAVPVLRALTSEQALETVLLAA